MTLNLQSGGFDNNGGLVLTLYVESTHVNLCRAKFCNQRIEQGTILAAKTVALTGLETYRFMLRNAQAIVRTDLFQRAQTSNGSSRKLPEYGWRAKLPLLWRRLVGLQERPSRSSNRLSKMKTLRSTRSCDEPTMLSSMRSKNVGASKRRRRQEKASSTLRRR